MEVTLPAESATLYVFDPNAPAARAPYAATVWAPYATVLEQQTLTENADVIREANFFWYTVQPDGSIAGAVQSPQAVETARAAGMRVVPSIANGDFDRERVAAVIGDPERRSAHVAEIVALVEANGFDGIDIDYESLHAEDREDFSLFIEALSAALHAKGKYLSVTVHPKTGEDGDWGGPQAQDWARLGAAADAFKIMVYDYHHGAGEAGPIAPLEWADAVLTYAATVVPPAKTTLGVPLYGYDWTGSQGQSLEWRKATALAKQQDAAVQRDPASGEVFFSYGPEGRHTVYFNDAKTLRARLDYLLARHPDIAGISAWRLGGEDPATWQAVRQAFGAD
jgi:spore germination protein YaaH